MRDVRETTKTQSLTREILHRCALFDVMYLITAAAEWDDSTLVE